MNERNMDIFDEALEEAEMKAFFNESRRIAVREWRRAEWQTALKYRLNAHLLDD